MAAWILNLGYAASAGEALPEPEGSWRLNYFKGNLLPSLLLILGVLNWPMD